MKITHHPPEDLLARFAAGTLEPAERLVLAVHASLCPHCRRFAGAIERIAGEALENVKPERLAEGAFESIMARIEAEPSTEKAAAVPLNEHEGLPAPLLHYRIGKRRRVAPGVSLRPILLDESGKSRAFLLTSAPGTRMVEHSHTGTELTCVLEGSFSHHGGDYRPGDFDFGDDDVNHLPVVGSEGPCLCVVAMSGDLRMNGFFGRLIGPFVRL